MLLEEGVTLCFYFSYKQSLSCDGCAESCFFFSSQFLRDVLDTLFCLLDENTDKYGPLVFQSLVGNL